MTGRTDFITDAPWEDVWLLWYVLVDDAYHALEQHFGPWRTRGPQPTFSDSEVITVALIIDTWWHGHEALGLAFLRRYHAELFPKLPPNGWFNARRTRLGPLIDQVRRLLTQHHGLLADDDPDRLVDSAPLPVCTYARAGQCRTLDGQQFYGVRASGHAKLFGFRLALTTSKDQVVDDWMLVPASHHDSQTLGALFEQRHGLLVLGDGAYTNPVLAPVLAAHEVEVLSPPRKNSRPELAWPAEHRRFMTRIRRRIETALSVLTQVFDLERPRSRSLAGLVCRVSTRLLAYNLCFITPALLAQLGSNQTPN